MLPSVARPKFAGRGAAVRGQPAARPARRATSRRRRRRPTLTFTLPPSQRPAAPNRLGLVAPSRDADHFVLLLRERLGALPGAARAGTLDRARKQLLVPLAGATASLLAEDRAHREAGAQLIERLRARLGENAVHGLARAPDHRPERWRASSSPAAQSSSMLDFGERPLWLSGAACPRRGPVRAVLRRARSRCSPAPSASNRAGGTATT